jgi:hypothetical protein
VVCWGGEQILGVWIIAVDRQDLSSEEVRSCPVTLGKRSQRLIEQITNPRLSV